jgi:4-amino-4-deoxy-L-arabinose transferase-like glycosyltransferase
MTTGSTRNTTAPTAAHPGGSGFRPPSLLLGVPPVVAAGLLYTTTRHHDYNELWFVYSAYYVLLALVSVYAGMQVSALRLTAREIVSWANDNWPGLVTTAAIAIAVFASVAPGYRVLADEANLVGVSKNLFFHRTANFAVTGKWYFESYWNIDEVTDRRPALFPFLVSLIHAVRGYRPENAFLLNAILFVLFVFLSYRLGKAWGGEALGICAALLVAATPTTLVSARSAGFDFCATFLLLVIVASFYRYVENPSPRSLALLIVELCLFTHVRYEGGALLILTGVVLLAMRRVRGSDLRSYGLLYSFVPLFLLPRYWQAVAKANDAEQPLTTKLFSASHFAHNTREFGKLALGPLVDAAHSPVLVILGGAGAMALLVTLIHGVATRRMSRAAGELVLFVVAVLSALSVLCFSYFEGNPLQPASARLFMWLDTFLAFTAAWLLVAAGRAVASAAAFTSRVVPVLASVALLVMAIPSAADPRFIDALIVTRQSAGVWRFFDKLGDKNILILGDRPGLYTIMNYGALDIGMAASDRAPLYELSRKLYHDIYLVQEMSLDTKKPLAGFDPWPDVETEAVCEFQNTESEYIRIARVKH